MIAMTSEKGSTFKNYLLFQMTLLSILNVNFQSGQL